MPQARLIPWEHQPGPIKTPASLPSHEACLPCHHASRPVCLRTGRRRQVKKVDRCWLSGDGAREPMKVRQTYMS